MKAKRRIIIPQEYGTTPWHLVHEMERLVKVKRQHSSSGKSFTTYEDAPQYLLKRVYLAKYKELFGDPPRKAHWRLLRAACLYELQYQGFYAHGMLDILSEKLFARRIASRKLRISAYDSEMQTLLSCAIFGGKDTDGGKSLKGNLPSCGSTPQTPLKARRATKTKAKS